MNRNTLYSETLVDELARAGLKHVVIAPGSRNTPLVLAFAAHPAISVHSILDERSAGFMALGLALATGTSAAILCTSGSAVANFFPAVVEAFQSRVPLLVITADRPQELRFSGANQTIDQVKIFGTYALWSVDMPLPEADMPGDAFRNLRTTANRAFARANGSPRGVVHLNIPFRKPLEPTPVPTDRATPPESALPRALNAPYTTISHGTIALNDRQLDMLASVIDTHERGIIVCGTNTPPAALASIARLGIQTHYPIFADATSGMRFGRRAVISAYDSFLSLKMPLPEAPEVVIRFGDLPTSQALNNYLDAINPAFRIDISGDGTWADDSHRTTHFIIADEKLACMQLFGRFENRPPNAWEAQWHALDQATWAGINGAMSSSAVFDGQIVWDIVRQLPENTNLFVGNSLPVRNFDQFAAPLPHRVNVFATRGASGIDGNVSVAVGIAAADPARPTVAIVGDITLYHDMNGLLALHRLDIPLTIIVINNDGGGIFRRLPIKEYDPTFTDLFITPHGLDFAHVAALYSLAYATAFVPDMLTSGASTLVEIKTDSVQDLHLRQAVLEAVQAASGST